MDFLLFSCLIFCVWKFYVFKKATTTTIDTFLYFIIVICIFFHDPYEFGFWNKKVDHLQKLRTKTLFGFRLPILISIFRHPKL